MARIVFSNALSGGWRPTRGHYPTPMTAIISLADHPDGAAYDVLVLHAATGDRDTHRDLGFHEGWGTVTDQLAALVEPRA